MVYWNVLVESHTKAIKNTGKLYIASGIIELDSGEFTCISAVKGSGGTVTEIKEEKRPEPKPEAPKVEVASIEQSKPEKKVKKKDNK